MFFNDMDLFESGISNFGGLVPSCCEMLGNDLFRCTRRGIVFRAGAPICEHCLNGIDSKEEKKDKVKVERKSLSKSKVKEDKSNRAALAEAVHDFCEDVEIYGSLTTDTYDLVIDKCCRYISKFGTKNLLGYFDRNFRWVYHSKYARASEICAMAHDLTVADDPLEVVLEMQNKRKDLKISSFGSPMFSDTKSDQEYDAIWNEEEAASYDVKRSIADQDYRAYLEEQYGADKRMIRNAIKGYRNKISRYHRKGSNGYQFKFLEIIDYPIKVVRVRLKMSKYNNFRRKKEGLPNYYAIVIFRFEGNAEKDQCSTVVDNRLLVEQLISAGVETRYKAKVWSKGQTIIGTVKEISREEIYSPDYDPETILNRYALTRPELGFRNYRWESVKVENKRFDLAELQHDANLQIELCRCLTHQ